MPNHCSNKLSVQGPEEDVIRWVGDHYKLDNYSKKMKFTFEGSVPMPEELHGTTSPVRIEGDSANTTAEEAEQLRSKYGFACWYEWSVANWGTKWDAYDGEDHDSGSGWREIWYTTAWCPPEAWLHTMASQYPTLSFDNTYQIEGEEPRIYIEATEKGTKEDVD